MPGSGKRRGEKYTGHLTPRRQLTQEELNKATIEQLEAWEQSINDAYDMDSVDANDYHNMPLIMTELKTRYAIKHGPLGLGVIPTMKAAITPKDRTNCEECGRKLTFGFKHGKKQPGGICTKGTCPQFAKPQHE